MILLGITGKKRAGKDTFADYVIENSRGKTEKMAFADALKDEVCAALGVNRSRIDQDKSLFRPILQWWGTEWRRGCFGDGYWIERLKFKIQASSANVIIVSDVRFRNEAGLVHALGGHIVRVVRPDDLTQDGHVSENDMNGYPEDFTIVAKTGERDKLRAEAAWMIDQLQALDESMRLK
jgi:hypothetical protein